MPDTGQRRSGMSVEGGSRPTSESNVRKDKPANVIS